jgi:uncharacterized OsmC-like protein
MRACPSNNLKLIDQRGEGVSLAVPVATLGANLSSVDAFGEDHMTMTKVATMPIEGIDTRQLEKFNEQYRSAPKNFELGIESRTIWEQKGLGNLGKVGRWTLGGQAIEKPTRDFSVQMGSWKEVGDAIGVEGADDRIEPIEAALLGLSSCVTEAIVLNCARTGVKLDGLDVKAHADIDPGPITGAKDPSDWDNTLKQITVDVTARGDFSGDERKMIEDGAKRSPVRYVFSKTGLLKTNFHYE